MTRIDDTWEYRVIARGAGEPTWSGNGVRYDNPDKAWDAAVDLFSRWMGCDAVAVIPAHLEPEDNGRFTQQQVLQNHYRERGL